MPWLKQNDLNVPPKMENEFSVSKIKKKKKSCFILEVNIVKE